MNIEIYYAQGAVMMRAKGAELLILPQHISHLQTLKDPKQFVDYFKSEALVNRPARKLFIAWERKDPTLWKNLYSIIHENAEKKEAS